MRLNISSPRPAPVEPYTCEVFCFPVEAVPFILHAIKQKAERFNWLSDEDYERGRTLLAEVGKELLMPCGKEISEGLDRIYRLIDTTSNGVQYTFSGTGTPSDPFVFSPPIPTVPGLQEYSYPGTRAIQDNIAKLTLNLVDGSPVAGVVEQDNFRQTLREIRDAILADTAGEIDYGPILLQILTALL